ncbi:MFS transporter [Paenibacillus guangzhouensis]|uniref:MFS transporter n=1 Tax=Paenibacillus guangzhouensis TaxID=1473112 RepID=UPI001267128C|nr:MFS transporter [Paenibacillus guangzhouensis]
MRILLKLLQAIFYSTNALLIPYMPLLLKSHGFSPLETGSLLALGPFIAIFAQPLAGMISDKIGAIRPILIVLWTFMGLSALLLFTTGVQSVAAVAVVALYVFFLPAVSLLDALMVKSAEQLNETYSSLRLWGSVGFMLTLIIVGGQFDAWGGVHALLWIFAPIWIGVLVIFLIMREPTAQSASGAGSETRLSRTMLRSALLNPSLFVFLGLIFLIAVPHRMNDTLLSLHMEHLGANASQISWAWAVAGASEVIGFYVMAKMIRGDRLKQLLGLTALLYAIRWGLYVFITEPWAIVALQITHMFTYVAIWAGSIEYISTALPKQIVATGQALLSMVFIGLGGLAGGSIGGAIQEHMGESAMYAMGVVCCAVAWLGFLVWNRRSTVEAKLQEA